LRAYCFGVLKKFGGSALKAEGDTEFTSHFYQ
jgi:hypothetical protein